MTNVEAATEQIVELLKIKAEGMKGLKIDLLTFNREDVEFLKITPEILYIQLQRLQTDGYITNLHPFDEDSEDESVYNHILKPEEFAEVLFIAKANQTKINKYKPVKKILTLDNTEDRPPIEYMMNFQKQQGILYIHPAGNLTFTGQINSTVLHFFHQNSRDNKWFTHHDLGAKITANNLEKAVKQINKRVDKKSGGNYAGIIRIKEREDKANRRSPNQYCWGLH